MGVDDLKEAIEKGYLGGKFKAVDLRPSLKRDFVSISVA